MCAPTMHGLYVQDLSSRYSETCLGQLRASAGRGLDSKCLQIIDNDEANDNSTCDFHVDQHSSSFIPPSAGIDINDVVWSCKLSPTKLCDGVSQCLTDECRCHGNQSDVFFCADGSGCITWDGLCNFVQDCMDGSDECFCPGFIGRVTSPVTGSQMCVPDTLNCSITAGGPFPAEAISSCDHESSKGSKNFNPIELCLTEAFEEFEFLFRNYI